MREEKVLRFRSGYTARIGLGTMAVTLISSAAFAQDQYFINVNPIQLCPGGLDNCVKVSPPGSSGIGFTDPATQTDITRAILSQAGIDVHWGPLQPMTTSRDTTLPPNTLQLLPGMVSGQVSSPQFQSLSDQSDQDPNAIKNGGMPSPVPPLSSDPHTINLFVNTVLNPNDTLKGSTYFGLGLIGNNGVVVDQAIFGSQSPIFGTRGAVPDAFAHELVHDLGLDHGTDNTPPLMTNLMSAARNEPTISGALSALSMGTAAQLNTQQIHNIIDPAHAGVSDPPTLTNSFLNPIPNIDTRISDKTTPPDFSVLFSGGGRPDESLQTLTLTAPAGFDPNTFFQFRPNGNPDNLTVNSTLTGCTVTRCSSLVLDFTGGENAFVNGDSVDYTLCVSDEGCVPVSVGDLAGGTYTYDFSDGYQTTSLLQVVNADLILDANSWHPDLAIPTGLDLALFTPFLTGLPCAMQPGMAACPPLVIEGDTVDDLIFFQAPEPPSVAVLFAGLGLWFAFDTRRRRRARAMPEYRG
jgi:hypothetical protein